MNGLSCDVLCRMVRAVTAHARWPMVALGGLVIVCGLQLPSVWGQPAAPDFPAPPASPTPPFELPQQVAPQPPAELAPLTEPRPFIKNPSATEMAPVPQALPNSGPSTTDAVVEVRVEGNVTIPAEAILRHVKMRGGRPVDEGQIREDVRELYRTRWFLSVEPNLRRTDAGLTLVFRVVERPIVRRVEYKGNDAVKTKDLAVRTGIEEGSPFDVGANREACRVLEQYYRTERGHTFATVELEKGGSRHDREVVFLINEGPKVVVTSVSFSGNETFPDTLLRTKTRSKSAILWVIGGKYDQANIPEDIAALKQYYHGLGYFDVKIKENITFTDGNWVPLPGDRAHAHVEYQIEEGPRYRVNRIDVYGTHVLAEEELREGMKLAEGEYFNARYLAQDIEKIRDQYGELGRLFAEVAAEPRYLEEPGVVDVVIQVNEDMVYRIRRVDVVFNGEHPHTRRSVVLNRVLTRPGELASAKDINLSRRRLEGSQFFERGVKVDIQRVMPDDGRADFRGQDPAGTGQPMSFVRPAGTPSPVTKQPPRRVDYQPDPSRASTYPDVYSVLHTAERSSSANEEELLVFRGQNYDPFIPPQNPLYEPNPQGDPLDPTLRQPRQGDVDLIYQLTEAQTGRLMFGVGVNSSSGVVGSIVLSENNFDLFNPPRSLQDITDGTAFRGGGQRFRAEAIPGTEVSRYLVSWTNPYFLDTDYSLGLSGFYYQRYFDDWSEERVGGRINVGYQFTPMWSSSLALRLEDIELFDADLVRLTDGSLAPTLLADAVGNNLLSTARFSVVHDTRDSAFLPGNGHRVELSYEQAFGDFDYPRFEADARQHYTLFERPDGGGRHILTVGGQVGWTGDDTPIFERFFAGGFQTFRGFDFRGVGPQEFGVRLGGQFLALSTIEYMFPFLANDMLHGVVFTDFGTVEDDIDFENFRASVGAGIRVTVPALGPVPLAFDWAVPLVDEDTDDRRLFSFYIGVNR